MQQHTHKAAIKSADSILDEFLLGQQPKQHQKYLKRQPQVNIKQFASSTQRQQNLLFSISGSDSVRDESYHEFSAANEAIEMNASANQSNMSMQIVHIQRKLIGFFFVYATIIITLYLTYAVYSYYQQQQFKRQQQQFMDAAMTGASSAQFAPGGITPASSLVATDFASDQDASSELSASSKLMQEFQTKLEGKVHLLERYIEVLALDLEDTKNRLKEREKCACSIGCSFNGTRFSDGQKWQRNCDICTCQAGNISCQPRECPKLANCDDPVQLPGRCCPTCMKKCKLNNTLVRHGHTFQPANSSGEPSSKQCKCQDGLIKCEPIKVATNQSNAKRVKTQQYPGVKNKTLEYVKTILAQPGRNQQQLQPVAVDELQRPSSATNTQVEK